MFYAPSQSKKQGTFPRRNLKYALGGGSGGEDYAKGQEAHFLGPDTWCTCPEAGPARCCGGNAGDLGDEDVLEARVKDNVADEGIQLGVSPRQKLSVIRNWSCSVIFGFYRFPAYSCKMGFTFTIPAGKNKFIFLRG